MSFSNYLQSDNKREYSASYRYLPGGHLRLQNIQEYQGAERTVQQGYGQRGDLR